MGIVGCFADSNTYLIPLIAIAIGVLTSNREGGRRTTLAGWAWHHRVPLQGGEDVVPVLGVIAGCHSSVLWLGGRVTTNFGGVDVVPGRQSLFHIFLLYSGVTNFT